jgi:MGT family glycosyltransferase
MARGRRDTVVFFPEGAFGPTNNCVGVARVLKERGYRVVFVVEESFAGTLGAQGFEEALMRLKPAPEVEEAPGQFWKEFIRDTAPQFRRPTIEQLESLTLPIWQELVDGSKYVDEQLGEVFDELRPGVIVEDNVVAFPAVVTAGVPWVRMVSCNPLEMKDPALPPAFSGYPAGDRSRWDEFRAEYARTHSGLWADFDESCRSRGAPGLPPLEFMYESPWLNLYVYPAEADYERSRPLARTWHRLGSSVRDEVAREFDTLERPQHGALVYLSLGSLGSGDVELMQRLIDMLSTSPHRVIVSMGPQHARLTLADNMVGAEFLPQPAILSRVDVVVTHGGNNTITECFHFGKPMVALPLFWDQYDNAQRVDELGFGIRLPTYELDDAELIAAIDRLAADAGLGERMAGIAARLQAEPGTVKAAGLIQGLLR